MKYFILEGNGYRPSRDFQKVGRTVKEYVEDTSGVHRVSVLVGVVVVVQLDTARVLQEEGTSTEKMPPPDWPMGKPVRHFLNWRWMWVCPAHCRCCHPWVGGHCV